MNKTPLALIILDGWGHREAHEYNPIRNAQTPFIDHLFDTYPSTLIEASGLAVGLPDGQMGNSEVGHLHIGAGRRVPQDLCRVSEAIDDGSFDTNPAFLKAIQAAKHHDSTIHVMGLLSPGGVHSHESHLFALMNLIKSHGVNHHLHAILDGRDTPPKSAFDSLNTFPISTLIGRYYAMDRDNRHERTQLAVDLYTQHQAPFHADSAEAGLSMAYERGETDEFVQPTTIGNQDARIQAGDVVIMMNFRADRARQLSRALLEATTSAPLSCFVTLTQYAEDIPSEIAFEPIEIKYTLGECIESAGLRQLRIAETEKYAHVTYFLNGGQESPFEGEERVLVPSPKVATYDLQPEMNAKKLTDELVKAIQSQSFDLIVCNYANPDMVGHTGIESAAEKAITTIDTCLKSVINALQATGGEALITSDHGNVELMFDPTTGQSHTAHTNNLVPLLYVGTRGTFTELTTPSLKDIAPTALSLLNIRQPREMTGHALLDIKS